MNDNYTRMKVKAFVCMCAKQNIDIFGFFKWKNAKDMQYGKKEDFQVQCISEECFYESN